MYQIFKRTSLVLAVTGLIACAHTADEKRKNEFQSNAQSRISKMESNIENLEQRNKELLGQPQVDLTSAINELKTQTAEAKDEVAELKARSTDTWLEKKANVDKELYDMDGAYNAALRVLTAH